MEKKGVDAIVANDISNMGSSNASGWWVTAKDEQPIHTTSKYEFAQQIFKHIMESNR
jgi:phosphopantothenoylcysteine decarboxylase/phosphopantothenate--cysteine ligase